MLIGQGLILPIDLILQVRDVMRCDLELPLKLDHFILSLNTVLRVQVAFRSDCFIQILLLLHLGLILHVLLLQFGDEVLFELDFFDHLHQVGVGFVGVLRVAVPFLLNLRNKPHQLRTSSRLQVKLLLQRADEVLLPAQFILVLRIRVLNLGQVLLHHVTLTDQVVDVLLFFVRLLVDPLDFAGQGRHGIRSDHLVMVCAFTLHFKPVVLAQHVLQFSLYLLRFFLELPDPRHSHDLLLLHFFIPLRQSIMRFGDILHSACHFIQIPLQFTLLLHGLGLLLIENVVVADFSLYPLDVLADSFFVGFDHRALLSDVLLKLLFGDLVLIELLLVPGDGFFKNLLFLRQKIMPVFARSDLRLIPFTLVQQLHFALLEFDDMFHFLSEFIFELLLLVQHLLHRVILREGETRPGSHDFVEVGDLLLQIGDDLTCGFFLFFCFFD